MKQKFDIIIIGSGGGSKLTRPAANLGFNVAIIDQGPLGGTCLNRGCIPSKMVIHCADIMSDIRVAKKFFISNVADASVDVKGLVDYVSKVVDDESKAIEPLYEEHDYITYYHDRAVFLSNKDIQVGDDVITADKIFIAVGARPYIPPIKGLLDTPFWTSTEALRVRELPRSLIIIGGGYIAVELGYYFQALGVEVTFLVRSKLIKDEDDDLIAVFESQFSRHHHLRLGCEAVEVLFSNDQFMVTLDNGDRVSADRLLVATGIQPNSDMLGLDCTDIQYDDQGFIQVNDCLETAVDHVYAFGDCIGRYQFRHSANFEGQFLFDQVVKQDSKCPIDYPPVPHAIFTNPQVAGVGLTERVCLEQDRAYYCGINRYKDSAMGMALQSDADFVKLIFDRKTHHLIGAHILGREAATMIHMCIMAMNLGANYDDFLRMIYIHPALPEVIRNAARNANPN